MKKVVSATLAGALAVGMVPAMALADDSVELLDSATVADDMAGASVVDYAGDLASGHKFTYNGKAQGLVPEVVKGGVSGLTYDAATYVEYYAIDGAGAYDIAVSATKVIEDCSFVGNTAPTAVGKYLVVAHVDDNGTPRAVQYAGAFEIVGKSLEGAEVVEIDSADLVDGIADDGIVYDGSAKEFTGADNELGILLDGELLTSYNVDAYYTAANVKLASAPGAAGDYKVAITATDAAHNGQKIELAYTIQKYDLSKATLNDVVWLTGTQPTAANVVTGVGALVDSDLVVAHSGTATNGHKVMTVTLNPAAAEKDSVTGTASLEYDIVSAEKTPAIVYAGDNTPADMTVGAVAPKVNFSIASVGAQVDGKDLKDGEFELVVKNAAGKVVDASVLEDESVAGVYQVFVKVVPSAVDYAYAGVSTDYIEVTIDNGTVAPATAAFIYDGKALETNSKSLAYTGDDFAKAFGTSVKTSTGAALVEGVDYTVEIKNAKDQVVTEAVNAGTYTFTIKSTKYTVAGTVSFVLTITPMVVEAVLVDYIDGAYDALYTGEETSPIAYFTTNINGKDVEVDVPADAYVLAISDFTAEKAADQPKDTPTVFKAAGEYEYTLTDKAGTDNYSVTAIPAGKFSITAKNVFVDVASDAWYADEVVKIVDAGIMGGYGNSKFGPNDTAERQDVAVMVLRTLEPISRITVQGGRDYTELVGLITGIAGELDLPFSDAKGNAYYSLGVWYANENGIMTGYADSDEFGVGDNITREQVAATLYRIDKGGFFAEEAPLYASALDAYVDADEVSKYAVEAMAWAVENGIMGVNTQYLNPGEEITRAELAAMFVRFGEYNAAAGKFLV